MASIVPDVQCIRKDGVVETVLWIYSSKTGEFYRSTVTVRVSWDLLGFGLGLVLGLGLRFFFTVRCHAAVREEARPLLNMIFPA